MAAPTFKVYDYPTSADFLPASKPTQPATRVPKDKILIRYCDEADLKEWAAICYDRFPDVFWDMVETEDRPPLPERIELMAEHFKPWLTQPGYHALKAVHADTGELMGIAGWAENGVHDVYPTSYKCLPGLKFPGTYIPCVWRDDNLVETGIAQRMGWKSSELERLKRHHDDKYAAEFLGYDRGRLDEIGGQPHWCLAPLNVWSKWAARGVGSELLRWGLDRADEKGWPVVLEALPNARPVYYHLGFEPTEDHGPDRATQLVRPGKKKSPTGVAARA